MKEGASRLLELIEAYKNETAEALKEMVAIKSISPLSGGEGEAKRADFIQWKLEGWGLSPNRYDYKDQTGAVRSNLTCSTGSGDRTVWAVAHIDTVSEGDRSLWASDPFTARVDDGKIYGRGTSDNGQEVIASMFAMRAIKESKIKTRYGFGIALVADEELGSRYGIQKLLREKVFKDGDMFIVPDWGTPSGDMIEVAEKGVLWLRITVTGKQVHASTPEKGINAYRYAIYLLNELDLFLHDKYNSSNAIFDPQTSTFEMTKHEKNVESVNIIPGVEVSYLDCRVLPQYSLDEVIKDVKKIASAERYKAVSVLVEEFNREDAAPQTPSDAEVVQLLKDALKDLRDIDATTTGIGGGTCAAFFRAKGLPAAVWSTEDPVAHEPNEYARLRNIVEDAKVLAYLSL